MATGAGSAPPDYVIIGHLTRDLIAGSERIGGTALYASLAGLRLGCRVGIVSAYGSDLTLPSELDDAVVVRTDSERTTTFRISHGPLGRQLDLLDRASILSLRAVGEHGWTPSILHLAPVAGEISIDDVSDFGDAWTIATPQGWMRETVGGRVIPQPSALEQLPLESWSAVVLSTEDVQGDWSLLERAAARVPLLAVTRGAEGCTLFEHGHATDIPAPAAAEVDTTGAGDVFAAAFAVRWTETGDARESATFACQVAARVVEGPGWSSLPSREELRAWRAVRTQPSSQPE